MKTLKSIDGKSLLIGSLLASTIFFATGATGLADKWDQKQQWELGVLREEEDGYALLRREYVEGDFKAKVIYELKKWPAGWEPIGVEDHAINEILVRRRIK